MLCRLRQAGRTFFGKKGKGLLRQIAAKDKRKAQPEAGSGQQQLCQKPGMQSLAPPGLRLEK